MEILKYGFVNKQKLLELLSKDHSSAINGEFFDEENKIVIEKIIKPRYFLESPCGEEER